jgi:hypothetical protein
MKSPRRRWIAPLCLALGLGLGTSACKKDGDSAVPGAGDEKGDGLYLAYDAAGFNLSSTIKLSLELAGMAAGTMDVEATGSIAVTPQDGGKLKVQSRVEEIGAYEATGDLKPEEKEGEEPRDPKEDMKGAETFAVTNERGEADEDATEGLAENVKKKEEAEKAEEAGDEAAQRRIARQSMGAAFITLPELPDVGLEEGKEIKVPTKEEERNLGGRKLPVEVDATYHLQKIDASSGARLATLSFKSEGTGADEIDNGQGGSVFVSYEEETEGTLVFNLDSKLPVSMTVEQATAIMFGENTAEQYLEIEASFEKK